MKNEIKLQVIQLLGYLPPHVAAYIQRNGHDARKIKWALQDKSVTLALFPIPDVTPKEKIRRIALYLKEFFRMPKEHATLYSPANIFAEQAHLNQRDDLPDGFYDDMFNHLKHISLEDAKKSNEYVTVFTVRDQDGILYYHLTAHRTGEERYLRFDIQEPRFGEDMIDHRMMSDAVLSMV